MVARTMAAFGKIDILVNNAGILRAVPFLNATEEDWDLTLDVNLKGVFLCSQAVAHKMVARKSGRIINVASNAGKVPRVNNAAYCASKAGVILLTKVMALELAKHGITANALCPGATETELLVKTQSGGLSQGLEGIIRGSLDTFRAGIPMGRLAKPEEQASMVLFPPSGSRKPHNRPDLHCGRGTNHGLKIHRGTDGPRARPAGDRRERCPYRLLKKSLSALISSFLWRKPESSFFNDFRTPAFAGVTVN